MPVHAEDLEWLLHHPCLKEVAITITQVNCNRLPPPETSSNVVHVIDMFWHSAISTQLQSQTVSLLSEERDPEILQPATPLNRQQLTCAMLPLQQLQCAHDPISHE